MTEWSVRIPEFEFLEKKSYNKTIFVVENSFLLMERRYT